MNRLVGVAYARFSSDKQQESSITVQLAEIKKFCMAHNIELIREYVDEAQTGTNANRKAFQTMVKDALDEEFQFIIVHRMDRWARNVDDGRYYKKYFARHGIKMVSAIEEFDETPEGEFFELMSMGMAELYSKKLARECLAGMLANARECKAHGGTPLLGYKVKGKKYVIEEKEAEIVKIIFDMTLKGYGYKEIRNYLNLNGYTRADGRHFTTHFYDILRNRKYIGEYVYNRSQEKDMNGKRNNHKNKPNSEIIRIPNGIPRIIDDFTFFKVQEILDERKVKGWANVPRRKYMLSGILRCAICGKSISGATGKCRDHTYRHYVCVEKKNACETRAINAEYLELYIQKLFNNCLFKEKNFESFCELIKTSYIETFERLQKEKSEMLDEIDAKEKMIKENVKKSEQDSMKALRKYLSNQNSDLRWEINELKNKIMLHDERINTYPEFKVRTIEQNIKKYVQRLKTEDAIDLRRTFFELIRVIMVDNDTIKTTLNLQRFLNGYEPMLVTITEKRDYIARRENHYRQCFSFAQLQLTIGE